MSGSSSEFGRHAVEQLWLEGTLSITEPWDHVRDGLEGSQRSQK